MTDVPAGPPLSPAARQAAIAERRLWLVVGFGTLVVLATAVTRTYANPILAVFALGLLLVAGQRILLAWPVLLGSILVVVLVIPIRRYAIGAGMPVQLEPYRLVVAVVMAGWIAALLGDPATRLRRTGLELPLIVFFVAILLSLGFNVHRVAGLGFGAEIVKQVTFFVSFALVLLFAANAVDDRTVLDRLLAVLVVGGAILAAFALYEWRSRVNVFSELGFIPILHLDPSEGDLVRGGLIRARASAQHPIALGALMTILLPFAVYLYERTRSAVWWVCAGLMTLGALVTISRTVVLMLVVTLLVFLVLRRAATVRMLPLLVPLVVCAQLAVPGTLGTMRAVLFPTGGVLATERAGEGSGTGRLVDVGPALHQWGRRPLFGEGFGTRLTSPDDPFQKDQILDDQWLSSLLEVGLLGVVALIWLFGRAGRAVARRARSDTGPDGWLFVAFAAALIAFPVGMLTYDAFSFIQVTMITFTLLGLSCAARRIIPAASPRPR